jgi:predicted phosphodiesterase
MNDAGQCDVDDQEEDGFPSEALIELASHRIAIRHILYERGKITKEGRAFLECKQPDVCIFGHTHQSKTEWFGKTLLFNPGSAGPKRFTLPRGIGLLHLRAAEVTPQLISLPDQASHILR